MEIRVLKYFLAVAREQSISAAADSLFLSQPTLSRQLKELEEELGKQLFIRGNRKITLTEEGVLLRKRAEEIMELISRTEKEIGFSDC
ncbi:MAG: LysR family transcriptional regulator, partial [Ruminococcus sp.]